MFWFRLALPSLYLLTAVLLPSQFRKISYFEFVAIFFWIPAALLLAMNWKWIARKRIAFPFFTSLAIGAIIAFFFEYVALGMGVWYFGPPENYVGPGIWGAPIEEFLFYWGAAPFCLLLYLYFYRLFEPEPAYLSLPVASAWFVMGLPVIYASLRIYLMIRDKQALSWPALITTVVIFFAGLAYVEHKAILGEFWIYNYAVMWDIRIWRIPLEEYVVFYWLGPTFTVFLFHYLELEPKVVFQRRDSSLNAGRRRAKPSVAGS
jgi:lycopene cyclase domain-containing protein